MENVIEQLSDITNNKMVEHLHKNDLAMPSIQILREIVETMREVFFPGYYGNSAITPESIKYHTGVNIDKIRNLLKEQIHRGMCYTCKWNTIKQCDMHKEFTEDIVNEFLEALPSIRDSLYSDVEAMFLGDPAANNYGEVIYCYPGIRAITNYRIAHQLVKQNVPLIPRIIGEMAHSETGIDIHPEASIGKQFTIDHGTGVVIGATCIIGNNVKLYQGVTLGAKSFPVDDKGNPIKGVPRHPIVEDNVVIYSGATVLGRITVGKNAVIGGNVWVTNNVPENAKILQQKAIESSFIWGAGI